MTAHREDAGGGQKFLMPRTSGRNLGGPESVRTRALAEGGRFRHLKKMKAKILQRLAYFALALVGRGPRRALQAALDIAYIKHPERTIPGGAMPTWDGTPRRRPALD